jgi:putative tryptophan/tyrosine transport system substrate-binding protein
MASPVSWPQGRWRVTKSASSASSMARGSGESAWASMSTFGDIRALRAGWELDIDPGQRLPHHPGVDRRRFLLTSLAGALATPLAAEAQQAGKVPRIGVLFVGPRNDQLSSYVTAHEEGLQELGWARNSNLIIEERFSGTMARMPDVVAELVNLKVRVIVTGPNTFIEVAKQITSTVPIVMVYATDPVGRGYVASLSRPGGNITGLAWDATPEIAGKYIDLLTQVRPASRIVGIVDPEFPDLLLRKEAESAAKIRGLTFQYVEVRGASDLSKAFATLTSQRANAIIVFQGPTLYLLQFQISELARTNKLPTLFLYQEGPQAGGLMSYGPNLRDSWRRAAIYVDKILKGARPAELPIEQPTKFELVINLKTAKALGLTIPPSLLARADQVIE